VTLPARILELGDQLRSEGVAIGTSELLDAFAALEQVGWTDQVAFRTALATTLAKSRRTSGSSGSSSTASSSARPRRRRSSTG
jgi:uncharacterized protein with von Willebrand factor type A (vWA) domain